VDDLWATKSEDVGLIVRAISFQDFHFNLYVIMIHQRHRQTDRQTDRRTERRIDRRHDMRSQDRALHYRGPSASRGKNGLRIAPGSRIPVRRTSVSCRLNWGFQNGLYIFR